MWGFLVVFNLKAPHVLTVATILSIFFRLCHLGCNSVASSFSNLLATTFGCSVTMAKKAGVFAMVVIAEATVPQFTLWFGNK